MKITYLQIKILFPVTLHAIVLRAESILSIPYSPWSKAQGSEPNVI
jgi:hypothetical protein